MATRRLEVEIIGDSRSLERAFGRSGRSASKFAGLLKGGAIAGIAALGLTAKLAYDELAEGQKVAAQTAAVIKSTGGAAKVTAKQVDTLAAAISNKTGIDDEAVAAGENMLLTFTRVRNEAGKGNDIFNQATQATADLSVAMGKDMTSSAMLVGKALNDPIRGLTALRRTGIQFTAAQEDQIRAMVESGDVMGAQKVILGELETQFGGSAKAFGETLPGQTAKARNAFESMAASVLRLALPAIVALAQGVARAATWIEGKMPAIRRAFQVAVDWIKANVVPPVMLVVQTVQSLWSRFGEHITNVARAYFGALRGIIGPLLATVGAIIKTFLALLRGDWGQVWDGLKGIVSGALRLVGAVLRGWVSVGLALAKAIGKGIWDGIKAGLTGLAGLGAELVKKIGSAIAGIAGDIYNLGKSIGAKIVDGVIDGLKGLPGAIASKVKGALGNGAPTRSPLLGNKTSKALTRGRPSYADRFKATGDRFAADIALSSLTPGVDDDLWHLRGWRDWLNSLLPFAPVEDIPGIVSDIKSADQQIADLTAPPVNDVTTDTPGGGGVTLNVYPSGAAADDPRALMAAASWYLRGALTGAI